MTYYTSQQSAALAALISRYNTPLPYYSFELRSSPRRIMNTAGEDKVSFGISSQALQQLVDGFKKYLARRRNLIEKAEEIVKGKQEAESVEKCRPICLQDFHELSDMTHRFETQSAILMEKFMIGRLIVDLKWMRILCHVNLDLNIGFDIGLLWATPWVQDKFQQLTWNDETEAIASTSQVQIEHPEEVKTSETEGLGLGQNQRKSGCNNHLRHPKRPCLTTWRAKCPTCGEMGFYPRQCRRLRQPKRIYQYFETYLEGEDDDEVNNGYRRNVYTRRLGRRCGCMQIVITGYDEVMVQRLRLEQPHAPENLRNRCRNKQTLDTEHLETPEKASSVQFGCADTWGWSKDDKSHEVRLYGSDLTAHFHPSWSSGTAGVRGSRALDGRRYYWELHVSQRVFGTSIMFGVATQSARLHADSFTNLLGEDANGWGLSHKGLLWHNGCWSQYTRPFRENEATTVGLLYDGVAGTLTYYKDGSCLGVAFRDLNFCSETLYPFVCSTAAKTQISLGNMRRDFVNLQDRCRDVIIRHIKSPSRLSELNLPPQVAEYVSRAIPTRRMRLFKPAYLNTMIDM